MPLLITGPKLTWKSLKVVLSDGNSGMMYMAYIGKEYLGQYTVKSDSIMAHLPKIPVGATTTTRACANESEARCYIVSAGSRISNPVPHSKAIVPEPPPIIESQTQLLIRQQREADDSLNDVDWMSGYGGM